MSEPTLVSGQMRYLLVVDSDWNDRFTLSMLLQRFGYTVASTDNAREGVEFLCVAPAVAVFTEAGAAGDELAARLRSDGRFRDLPLIMVDDGRDRGLEERLKRGEFAGLLRTPVNPDEVFQVVQKAIENGSRQNIRITTALPAELDAGSGAVEGFVTVLSQYGMFFRTLTPLPAHAHAGVRISIGDRVADLRAEVLYVVTFEQGPFCEPGMGMKFVDLAPEDSALIRFFIHEQVSGGIIPGGPLTGQA